MEVTLEIVDKRLAELAAERGQAIEVVNAIMGAEQELGRLRAFLLAVPEPAGLERPAKG